MLTSVRAGLVAALIALAVFPAAAADKPFTRGDLNDAAIKLEAQIKSDAGAVSKPAAQLRKDADAAFQKNDFRTGMTVLGQLVTTAPDDAASWLRVAMMLRRRGDTGPEGLNAIRHFHALQPDNRLGDAIFSLYLSDSGQNDSALAYASLASADSALREYASLVYLRVGAHMLQSRDFERAARVLSDGRNMATPGNHARYSLYLAHANIQRAVPLFQDAVAKKNCTEGNTVDSILTTVDHDLHESISLDSVQSQHIIDSILPQFKSRVAEFKGTCR